ncbi:hypothetical protein [Mucisphaera calidilacus]|uniref:Uncharacterized protein n=1 Tax=Mucisphaera calidilacus TaxID=2527982 RepID=A0A518BXN2_9BACT|nr:hypothetical protein [Mucisphaera calidilacus]QDU71714.1 hypothetical protein Pan265_15670 [Mucisphaera calidilacus]
MIKYLVMLSLVLCVAGCEAMESMGVIGPKSEHPVEKFVFDTGGDKHAEGFGGWRIEYTRGGKMSLTHTIGEDATTYGPLSLSSDVASTVWEAVDRLPFDRLSSDQTEAVPGDLPYYFGWTMNGKARSASLPSSAALKEPMVLAMNALLGEVIEAQTGVEPVLE